VKFNELRAARPFPGGLSPLPPTLFKLPYPQLAAELYVPRLEEHFVRVFRRGIPMTDSPRLLPVCEKHARIWNRLRLSKEAP
jgi:hypothetical protein